MSRGITRSRRDRGSREKYGGEQITAALSDTRAVPFSISKIS
jgi:hypothetical protein